MGCGCSTHAQALDDVADAASPVAVSNGAIIQTSSVYTCRGRDDRTRRHSKISAGRRAMSDLVKSAPLGNLLKSGSSARSDSDVSSKLTRRSSGNASGAELQRRTSAVEDPLGIGKESESVSAPTRWLLVIGTPLSGKSSLIRELKGAFDDFDETEASRFVKEVHKGALDAFREVLKLAPPLGEEKQAVINRINQLRRRSPITREVASDIKMLWSEKMVADAAAGLESPQLRLACRHFLARLDDIADEDFVPELQDLMHVRIPTIGQQETRLDNFPGGPLSIFEVKANLSSPIFEQGEEKQDMLLGSGLRGIVFIASVTDAMDVDSGLGLDPTQQNSTTTDASGRSSGRSSSRPSVGFADGETSPRGAQMEADPQEASLPPAEAPAAAVDELAKPKIVMRREALKLKHKAENLATRLNVPCMTVLTKTDVLSEAILDGLTPISARLTLQEQLRTCAGIAKVDEATSGSDVLCLSLAQGESNFTSFQELMMCKAFPEADLEDDEAVGLGDAVYMSYFCYNGCEKKVLCYKGVLPTVRFQPEALSPEDHLWLHRLPSPLPNPKVTSPEMARRLGKCSPNPMQAKFWTSLEMLSDQLGAYRPEYLGVMHAVPLLVCAPPGALLLTISETLTTLPSFSTTRKLTWRPISQLAQKTKHAMPAVERYKFGTSAGNSYTYKHEAEEALLKLQPKDLDPIKWLSRLRDCSEIVSKNASLTAGTYVCAFYALSGLEGFSVLLHMLDHSMPPFIKISNHQMSAADWKELSAFGRATSEGGATDCPDNWAAAKSWMGPEIANEDQFTMLQKFFYGVIALRQRLGRQCTAMHEELRSSQAMHAPACLSSLGKLHSQELITLGKNGEVQIIMVTNLYNLSVNDSLPAAMKWYSLPLFEARHYNHHSKEAYHTFCDGRHILDRHLKVPGELKTLVKQSNSNGCGVELRTSGMRTSGMRDSGMRTSGMRTSGMTSNGQSPEPNEPAPEPSMQAKMKIIGLLRKEDERLEQVWEPLRWTKRILKSMADEPANKIDRGHHHVAPKAQQQAAVHQLSVISVKSRKIVHNVHNYASSMEAFDNLSS